MKEITVEELFSINNPVIIDIRSPIEFKESSIPGAINIPLFTDDERKEIGTIYKNEGQDQAKWRAMELVSHKIPDLLQSIKEASGKSIQPIIHCWRGGTRSKAVATFLDFAGVRAKRLIGGYKAYREYILKEIPTMFPEKAVVLHGLTGVGKTEILKILSKEGYPVLDLEAMAGHRGSIFGTIGLNEGHNQKTFDSLLFKQLQELQEAPYFLMEAESKRIGKASQPDELMIKKIHGIHIQLHIPIEQRVTHLVNEYVTPFENLPWYFGEIQESLERVFRREKDPNFKKDLAELLEKCQYAQMIKILLESYYDPKYDHKRQEYVGDFFDIFATSHQEATEKIKTQLDKLSLKPQFV
ncbi:tRNA 2-selenouridine(34) synthase MnmH [Neobacillus sp. PS3-40]|uniref:tRNA 2-selenouridine(34) synthase MnmH n=1 Tax=Neobacillus sp. PS3-40 TaxID=3070679 RepID=UPI0027E0DB5C|nr:tRNA 2-selenouridine(34) synthase MnmH [Neobacillus sp. PS3-40]WML44951.1 tRNA 2-selenouridine(34) synthase MnmH [Neobacillus sp. PS3-40]